jgi:hypothetical protein
MAKMNIGGDAPIFGGTLDPGSATFQEEEDKFNWLPDVRVPTAQDLSSPQFATEQLDRRQQTASRAAATEVRSGMRGLGAEGREMFDEELAKERGEDKTDFLGGFFDILQAGQFTTAGFAQELANTGDFGSAMKQAGIEWLNAMPGIELEDARRPSYSDVLRDAFKKEGEDESTLEKVAVPIAGFMLDIALDPVTWLTLGTGTAAKVAAKGGMQATTSISKGRRIAQAVANPSLALGAEAIGAARKAGGTADIISGLASKGVPGAKKFGQAFTPGFDLRHATKQIGEGKSAAEQGQLKILTDQWNQLSRERNIALTEGTVKAQEQVHKLLEGLEPEHRILFQFFMDQGDDVLRSHISAFASRTQNPLSEEALDKVMEHASQFRKHFKDLADEEMKVSLLSKHTMLGDYAPISNPIDEASASWSNQVLADNDNLRSYFSKELGIPEEQVSDVLAGTPGFARPRAHRYFVDRIQAGIPAEMDIGRSTMRRTIQSQKAVTTRNLLNSFFADEELVRVLTPNGAEGKSILKTSDDILKLQDPEYVSAWRQAGYVLFDPNELKKLDVSLKGKETTSAEVAELIGRYGQEGDFKEKAYWIPEAFADDLMQTQKIFSDDGFVKEFVNKFSQVQGVWKMYALMSPGYHMRNLYSNLFQNFIGGVTNPKRYMEAMAIQAGGTNNLPVGVRHAVEAVVGRKGVDDVIFESNGKSWTIREAQEHGNKSGTTTQGMFAQDIPIELERDMMKNLDRIENVQRVIINKYNFTKGADKMRQDAIAAGSDPEVATHNAQIGNAMAHNWALKNGKDPEEWWYKFNVKDLTERQPDAYWGQELFRISDEEFGEPAYQLYGKLEEAMQGVFTSHGVDGASAATLKKELSKLNRTPGGKNLWRSIYDDDADMVDPSVLMDKIQRILELDMGNDGAFKMHKWYKEFGDGVADTVGEQNMPEFAGVFAIMSPQRMVEQDLAESIYVMRKVRMLKSSGQTFNKENFLKAINEDRVRTSTTKTGQMSDQAQKIYLSGKNNIEEIRKDQAQQLWDFYSNEVMGGGLKTTNFAMTILHRQKSDFFPGVVNDVQMAKQFGFHKNGKHIFNPRANHAQYRYAQNVVAQIAKTLDISPDEAMAALWYDAKLSDDFTREVLDDGTVLRKMDKTPKGRLGENWPHADTGAYDTEGRILSRIGSWESASAHSKPELDMARAMGMADSESLITSFDYDEVLKLSDEGASRKDILRILAKKFSDEGFEGPKGALYQAQPSTVQEAQDILGKRMGDLFNEDPSLQTVATGTSRKLHETTATSKALMETIDPDNAGAVLDFGAGKSALQSGSLRKSGYNVTSHDFGDNVKEGVHDPDALTRQYDTVMASNMINTQGSDEMLEITLDQLQIATKSGGRLILNLPISPRKGAWQAVDGAKAPKELREADVDKLVNNLSERYEQVEIISGTPASGPVIMASNPKKGGFDREVMGKRLGIKDDTKGGLYQMSGGEDSTWGNKLRGAIWKDPDFNVGDYTNYIIGLHRDNQNATTLAHEMGHLFRLTGDIPTDQKKALDKFVGADSSLPDMGVEAEEKFARAWESFLMKGKTPTPGLREVFHDMKSKFEDVYNTVPPEQIDDNIKSVFDSMFDRIRPQEYAEYAIETIGEKSTYEKTVESMKRFGRKRFGIDSWQVQKNMAMGRHMENNSRMAHWLQKMLDGNTVEASDSSVRKYLFDYDELTEFEKKVMRNIIPFYTWSRKNIPLQIQAVFEDPARYQLAPKMMEMIEQFSHEWGDIEGPDYFQQQHMLRLPLMYNEQPAFINPDLPFQSLQDIRVDPFVAGMTPFAKWMTEWWPKHAQSMFTDRPIERYPGEPSALIPGIDKKTEVNLGNIFPTLGKIQRLAQAASRGEAGAQLSGEITGLRIMPVDEQKVARSKRFQKREVLRRVKRKIRDLEEQDEPVKRVKRGRPRKED